MCGIAGMMTVNGAPPPASVLQGMEQALLHRGPDGRGHYRSGDVGMVQTRLAIIDLATGDQPLYEPGGAALVANGEIYNYLELRQKLAGIAFATSACRDRRPRSPRIQRSRSSTSGTACCCRTVRRCAAGAPLTSLSRAKIASIRRTASTASGALPSSANEKNFRRPCAQHAASRTGPGNRAGA